MDKGLKSKKLLYFALGFLVLGITVFGILQSKDTESIRENTLLSTAVLNSLKSDGIIAPSEKQDVELLMHSTKYISNIKIYAIEDILIEKVFDYANNAKPDIEYSRDKGTQNSLFIDKHPHGSGNGEWYIVTEQSRFHTLSVICLFLGGLLYAILFSTWAIKDVSRQQRLNVKWAITFVLFNIVGYLFFLFVDKNRTNFI
ncbi:hypothetical protein [Bacillus sp. FJAT-22090]|uniref:hypothetical protein n=1 Tax=Bacillus sp. FJAT-22090 TaxID=1581038 RepID=UPI0011A4194A|nr:hypothetical protein [Bacillus sp. FJAT-22090]